VEREYWDCFGSTTVSIGMFVPYLSHYTLQKTVFRPPNRHSKSRLRRVSLPGEGVLH
jgi:hypothetical protein